MNRILPSSPIKYPDLSEGKWIKTEKGKQYIRNKFIDPHKCPPPPPSTKKTKNGYIYIHMKDPDGVYGWSKKLSSKSN